MSNQAIIAVLQAAEAGKKVQHRFITGISEIARSTWVDTTHHIVPSWDFHNYEYRVKPEPREFYAIEFPPLGPVGGKLHLSRESAEFHADDTELYRKPRSSAKIIKLREVLES